MEKFRVAVMKAFALPYSSNRLKYQALHREREIEIERDTDTTCFMCKGPKIDVQAIFIGKCAEISTLSRSTFEQ